MMFFLVLYVLFVSLRLIFSICPYYYPNKITDTEFGHTIVGNKVNVNRNILNRTFTLLLMVIAHIGSES